MPVNRGVVAALCLLSAGCAKTPVYDQPSMIVAQRLSSAAPVEASAAVSNLDGKPAFARLYMVPAVHADEALAAIEANGGRLDRWALFVLANQPLDGGASQSVSLQSPPYCCVAGDLTILAIDPLSPGRFAFSGAHIAPVAAQVR